MIIHMDMDAFFAAIEQVTTPGLKNSPTIVHGSGERHSVVLTASYEARRFGIRSGIPLKKAKLLCPEGHFVKSNPEKYIYFASGIQNILHKYSRKVEIASIDEAYIEFDLHSISETIKTAIKIKTHILRQHKLTCSMGISTTRMFAKISTEIKKPNGLTCIPKNLIKKNIYTLPVGKIPGVGSKTEKFLNMIGIIRIGDLINKENQIPLLRLGKFGKNIIEAVKGERESIIFIQDNNCDEKSLSNEATLDFDTLDRNIIRKYVHKIIIKLSRRLRKRQLSARTIAVKIRYFDFKTILRQHSHIYPICREDQIFKIAFPLISDFLIKPVRLIGIKASNLLPVDNHQINLFDPNPDTRTDSLYKTIDVLKDRYGEEVILPAMCFKK